jgi:hypothetical protein
MIKLKPMSLRKTIILNLLEKALEPGKDLGITFRVLTDKVLNDRKFQGDKRTLDTLEELNKAYLIVKSSHDVPREIHNLITIDYSVEGDGSGTARSEILAVHEELFIKCIDVLDLGYVGYDEKYNGNLEMITDEVYTGIRKR